MEIMGYFTITLIVLMVLTAIIALCEMFDLDEDEAFCRISKRLTDNITLLYLIVPCYLTYKHRATQVICRLCAVISCGLALYVPYELMSNSVVMWDLPYIIGYMMTLICLAICVYMWILAIKLATIAFFNGVYFIICLFKWIFCLDEKKFQEEQIDSEFPQPSTQDDADID
jgi:hypothetical protein